MNELMKKLGTPLVGACIITPDISSSAKSPEVRILTSEAIDHLSRMFREDPNYAWSWHCNIACRIMDEDIDHAKSNKIAANIMQAFFDAKVEDYKPESSY